MSTRSLALVYFKILLVLYLLYEFLKLPLFQINIVSVGFERISATRESLQLQIYIYET